jgi:hypothetical protein
MADEKKGLKSLKGLTLNQKLHLNSVYEQAAAARQQGMGYSEVNAHIRTATGGRVGGLSHLERLLNTGEVRAAREEKYRAEDVAAKGRGEKLVESVQNVGDAMMLGWGGEAAGAVGAGIAGLKGQDPGEAFYNTQEGADTLVRGARATNPAAAGVGRAAGMMAPGMAAAGMMPARAAAGASLPLRGRLIKGLGTTAAAAAGGAVEGASDPRQEGGRWAGAEQGAKLGGAVGAGIGLGLPLAGAAFAATGIGPAVGDAVKPAARRAHGLLAGMLEDAGIAPGQLAQRMDELPAGSAIGDLSGGMRRRTRAIKNLAPDIEDTPAFEAIEARAVGTGERMAGELIEAAGVQAGYQPRRVFREGRKIWKKNQLDPILEGTPEVSGLGLSDLVGDNREFRRALKKAGIEGEAIDGVHKTQDLWAAREQLLFRSQSPKLDGAQKQEAWDAIEQLTKFMDERVTGFEQMLSQYKHLRAVESAFEVGEVFGGRSVRELGEAMDDMNLDDPEIAEALRQGVASWFNKGLEDAATGGTVASKLRNLTPRMRNRLKILFGDDTGALEEYVERTLKDQEARWAKLHNAIRGNSTTAQQLSDMDGVLADPTRAPRIRDFTDRLWLVLNTSPGTRRETLLELGQTMLADDLSPEQIRVITDSMLELVQRQGVMRARVAAPLGAQASQAPGLFDEQPTEPEAYRGFNNF